MKKYLSIALAMPLLFACSSEDFTEKQVVSNDQFPGIEKVDASFSMDLGKTTRMATDWALEEGDQYGFAWLTDDHTATPAYTPLVAITGDAFQNHPLTQTDGIFKPATSIYVGKYYIYRPYDETTVAPGPINFNSLLNQKIKDGMGGTSWAGVAKNAIIIGDKWTEVTPTGADLDGDGKIWNKAGLEAHNKIYAAVFSNQTGLDLTYANNDLNFDGKQIVGASDIDYTYPTGSAIGAAEIYGGSVMLSGASSNFTYAPTAEPNAAAHDGGFWADQKGLGATEGFAFTKAPITLNGTDDEGNGISTDKADKKGWIWFNSLPVVAGNATPSATTVAVALETTFGSVFVANTLDNCAFAYEIPTGATAPAWLQIADADNLTTEPIEWNPVAHETFINHYGNHKGKYVFDIDFATGNMNGMHIKNDAHLQKLLKYYIATGKTSTVTLNLDGASATDKTFKLSKLSIALLQTINSVGLAATPAYTVKVQACPTATHNTPKVIVTQDGQDAIGLGNAKEVPALDNVFAASTDVYLSSECEWTWSSATALPIDANVASLRNEGTLNVSVNNIELSVPASNIYNTAGATMNITQVTTVKNSLQNEGTINVGAADNTAAELRAYGATIFNTSSSLTAQGVINNYGVVGVTEGTTPAGKFNNYGIINMLDNNAMTFLSSNQKGAAPFKTPWSTANKMGTVVLPTGKPYAIVSVNNAAENGFIKYNWTSTTYAHDTKNVKYNTIVVSNDITFSGNCTEIQFIEFNGTRTQVVNPTSSPKLPNLKGVIVNDGKSIIIEKNNELLCSDGAYLGDGATVYNGGKFNYGSTNNYLGTWSTDQIVKY